MSFSAALKSRIENLVAMAQLLERVDANPALVGAEQYRILVRKVEDLLGEDWPEDALRAVLRACPASALLYENLHYDRSGLSQSALDEAVAAELATRQLLESLRARAH